MQNEDMGWSTCQMRIWELEEIKNQNIEIKSHAKSGYQDNLNIKISTTTNIKISEYQK